MALVDQYTLAQNTDFIHRVQMALVKCGRGDRGDT